MDYVFIGILLGSLVTSTHPTREACEGRAVMLKEKGVVGECEPAPSSGINLSYGSNIVPSLCSDGSIQMSCK